MTVTGHTPLQSRSTQLVYFAIQHLCIDLAPVRRGFLSASLRIPPYPFPDAIEPSGMCEAMETKEKNMLVVTRRTGESIMITAGEHEIEVTILGISGGQIRIGTQAPAAVAIVRKEIAHRYQGRPS